MCIIIFGICNNFPLCMHYLCLSLDGSVPTVDIFLPIFIFLFYMYFFLINYIELIVCIITDH